MPDSNYERYKKSVKRLGAKQVATPEEFKRVRERLVDKYWVQALKRRSQRVLKTAKKAKPQRFMSPTELLRKNLSKKEIARLKGKK